MSQIQQIITGPFGSLSDTQPATSYHPINAGNNFDFWDDFTGDDTYAQFLVTKAGTLSNFRSRWAGPGSGKTVTLTIMKNGVATTLEISRTGFVPSLGADTTHSISVVPGDLISVKNTGNDVSSNSFIWSLTFTGNDPYSSIHSFGGRGLGDSGGPTGRAPDDTVVSYAQPLGDAFWLTTEEVFIVAPVAGKIKNMYVKLDIAPGGGKGFTYTFRKNSVDTTLSVEITGSATTGNDTTHEISVVAGDLISVKATPSGTPALACPLIGFTFESSLAGQFPMFASCQDARSIPAEAHAPIYGMENHGDSSPDDKQDFNLIFPACTFKSMYVVLDTAPGSGNSKVFTLQKNTVHGGSFNGSPETDYVDTAMTLTIANSDTEGSVAMDISFDDDDKGLTAIDMVSSPAAGRHFISYSVYSLFVDPNPDTNPINGAGYCPYVSQGQVRKMVNNVTGLDHLNGEIVHVQADGIPADSKVYTVTAGTLDSALPKKAAVIHVGLKYKGRIKLLKSSDGNPNGTGQMKMRRIFLAGIRVFRSLGFKIGIDEDHLDPVILGKPALPLTTGDLDKLPNTKWKKDAQLTIIQDKPMPLFILALINQSEVEDI